MTETELAEALNNDPTWLRADRDSWRILANAANERAVRLGEELEAHKAFLRWLDDDLFRALPPMDSAAERLRQALHRQQVRERTLQHVPSRARGDDAWLVPAQYVQLLRDALGQSDA